MIEMHFKEYEFGIISMQVVGVFLILEKDYRNGISQMRNELIV